MVGIIYLEVKFKEIEKTETYKMLSFSIESGYIEFATTNEDVGNGVRFENDKIYTNHNDRCHWKNENEEEHEWEWAKLKTYDFKEDKMKTFLTLNPDEIKELFVNS